MDFDWLTDLERDDPTASGLLPSAASGWGAARERNPAQHPPRQAPVSTLADGWNEARANIRGSIRNAGSAFMNAQWTAGEAAVQSLASFLEESGVVDMLLDEDPRSLGSRVEQLSAWLEGNEDIQRFWEENFGAFQGAYEWARPFVEGTSESAAHMLDLTRGAAEPGSAPERGRIFSDSLMEAGVHPFWALGSEFVIPDGSGSAADLLRMAVLISPKLARYLGRASGVVSELAGDYGEVPVMFRPGAQGPEYVLLRNAFRVDPADATDGLAATATHTGRELRDAARDMFTQAGFDADLADQAFAASFRASLGADPDPRTLSEHIPNNVVPALLARQGDLLGQHANSTGVPTEELMRVFEDLSGVRAETLAEVDGRLDPWLWSDLALERMGYDGLDGGGAGVRAFRTTEGGVLSTPSDVRQATATTMTEGDTSFQELVGILQDPAIRGRYPTTPTPDAPSVWVGGDSRFLPEAITQMNPSELGGIESATLAMRAASRLDAPTARDPFDLGRFLESFEEEEVLQAFVRELDKGDVFLYPERVTPENMAIRPNGFYGNTTITGPEGQPVVRRVLDTEDLYPEWNQVLTRDEFLEDPSEHLARYLIQNSGQLAQQGHFLGVVSDGASIELRVAIPARYMPSGGFQAPAPTVAPTSRLDADERAWARLMNEHLPSMTDQADIMDPDMWREAEYERWAWLDRDKGRMQRYQNLWGEP